MQGLDNYIAIEVAKRAGLLIDHFCQWDTPESDYLNQSRRENQQDAAIMSVASGADCSTNPAHHRLRYQLNKAKTQKTAKQCDHIWSHYYNFMSCGKCGESEDIPTAREYLQQ